jgi:hypothetical protein
MTASVAVVNGSDCGDWRAVGPPAVKSIPEGLSGLQRAGGGGHLRPHTITLVDGEQLKYCPGTRCRMYLPLFQFGSNLNMEGGRDTYCVECNQAMRRAKEDRRRRSRFLDHHGVRILADACGASVRCSHCRVP